MVITYWMKNLIKTPFLIFTYLRYCSYKTYETCHSVHTVHSSKINTSRKYDNTTVAARYIRIIHNSSLYACQGNLVNTPVCTYVLFIIVRVHIYRVVMAFREHEIHVSQIHRRWCVPLSDRRCPIQRASDTVIVSIQQIINICRDIGYCHIFQ